MLGWGPPIDPLVVGAGISRAGGDVADAGLFPERNLATPIVLVASAGRGPHLDAHRRRVATGLAGQRAQLLEGSQCLVISRICQGHKAVAIAGAAAEGGFGMAAVPDRHPARSRTRVDAGIVDVVELALELDMRLGPQRLHDAHLVGRAAAAIVKIFVEAGELDLVPADPDAEPEAAAAPTQ